MSESDLRAYARAHGWTLRRVSRSRKGYKWNLRSPYGSMWAVDLAGAKWLLDGAIRFRLV